MALFVLTVGSAMAQQTVTEFDFDFESGDSTLNVNYKDNFQQINRLVDFMSSAKLDPNVEIVNVEISGFTTLENSHESNTETSELRSLSLRNILSRYSDISDNVITYNGDYIDWQWLKKVINDANVRYKEQAQEIINRPRTLMKYNGSYTRDRRIFGLRWLGQGELWRYMEANVFPEMSKGSIKITTVPKGQAAQYAATHPVGGQPSANDYKMPTTEPRTVTETATTVEVAETPATPAEPESAETPMLAAAESVATVTETAEPVTASSTVSETNATTVSETTASQTDTATDSETSPTVRPKVVWSTGNSVAENTSDSTSSYESEAASTTVINTPEGSSAELTSTVSVSSTPETRETVITETVSTSSSNTSLTADITTDKSGAASSTGNEPIPTSQLAATLGTKFDPAKIEPSPTADIARRVESGDLEETTRTIEDGIQSASAQTASSAGASTEQANMTPKVMWSTGSDIVEAETTTTSTPAAPAPAKTVASTTAVPSSDSSTSAATSMRAVAVTPSTRTIAAATPVKDSSLQETTTTGKTSEYVPVAVKMSRNNDGTQTPVTKASATAPTASASVSETVITESTTGPIPTARLRKAVEERGIGTTGADSRLVAEFTETTVSETAPQYRASSANTSRSTQSSSATIITGSDGNGNIVVGNGDIILDKGNTIVVRPDKLIIQPNTIIIRTDNIVVDDESDNGRTTLIETCPAPGKPTSQAVDSDTDASFRHKASIKTNLVNWGLGQVNFAIDFDLGRHWSFSLPFAYSGWNYGQYKLKFRICDIKPEIRYWPSRNNTGFFVGVHGGVSWFNFAFNGDYRYTNTEQPAYGGGLSLGCRFPISRNRHWNMEFGVSGGVYNADYRKYDNTPGGDYIGDQKKTYCGIDGASISFLYSFRLK